MFSIRTKNQQTKLGFHVYKAQLTVKCFQSRHFALISKRRKLHNYKAVIKTVLREL